MDLLVSFDATTAKSEKDALFTAYTSFYEGLSKIGIKVYHPYNEIGMPSSTFTIEGIDISNFDPNLKMSEILDNFIEEIKVIALSSDLKITKIFIALLDENSYEAKTHLFE